MQNLTEIFSDKILKAVISNPKDKNFQYKKITIWLKCTTDGEFFHIEKYTEKQAFQENIPTQNISDFVNDLLYSNYKQFDAWSENCQYGIKISKKGKETYAKKKITENVKVSTSHNREKNYILKENDAILPLIDLGIFTNDGKIVRQMYDKFKQINRFVEIIDDVISKSEFKEMKILDFGCGKSYLTFILYHYLVNIKNINAHIIGLDLKKDVIQNCNLLAKKYGYKNLKFEVGDIGNFNYKDTLDMVITLHACDTATDFALYNAIRWNSKIILSVPCCQHELNSQIKTEGLTALTKYGLIKERFSALATDTIRGCLLESEGYGVQLMEFVDLAHSPKNVLIRAVKKNVSENKRKKSLLEAEELMNEFGFELTLYRLLQV